jgi:2,4-dienoyl-CoA reductase (NADPH2)
MAFEKLLSPVTLGSMELRNHLVMSPITTDYAGDDQLPTPRLLDYLEARARGGAGLVTLEACSVDPRQREVLHSMHFGDDSVVSSHRELTERVHACGARIQPQLVHPGPDSMAPHLDGTPSVGPSVIPSYLTGHPCRELEAGEIGEIVESFGEAARRIRACGYDGLELHAAHGYMLLGSFLSPVRNRRSDAYGARTLEGRLRLLLEVIGCIKERAGHDFPLTLRISGYERLPGGRRLTDSARMAPRLVAAGVDAFHVSGGVIDRYVTQIVTRSDYGDAHNVGAAAAVKQVVDVPVMVVGRIHDPRLAETILARGQADLIAMGRPLLADPELPSKVRTGRLHELRRCISCQHCIDSMERLDMSCAVNGTSGREAERPVSGAPRPRRVLVVGGGCAGLEAARVAALRGHEVVLCERHGHLGGSLLLAATVHRENEPLLEFLVGEVRRLGVEVRLGYAVSAEDVSGLRPDVVLAATGGRLVVPRLPGDDLPHVSTGADLRRLVEGRGSVSPRAVQLLRRALSGSMTPGRLRGLARLWLPLGRRVAIVGGDLAAVELGEFLAARGRSVTLLESEAEIAPEVGMKRRSEHMDRLDRLGVAVHTRAEVDEIAPGGLRFRPDQAELRWLDADSVLLAGRIEPDPSLCDALTGGPAPVHALGDCTGLGLIAKAISDAVRVACTL